MAQTYRQEVLKFAKLYGFRVKVIEGIIIINNVDFDSWEDAFDFLLYWQQHEESIKKNAQSALAYAETPLPLQSNETKEN